MHYCRKIGARLSDFVQKIRGSKSILREKAQIDSNGG